MNYLGGHCKGNPEAAPRLMFGRFELQKSEVNSLKNLSRAQNCTPSRGVQLSVAFERKAGSIAGVGGAVTIPAVAVFSRPLLV
jgi:hypothetical protein